MASSSVYFKNLNGLRFFAALSVIIYHVFGIDVLNGHLGVTLFFVLSGFLITSLLFKEIEVSETVNVKYFLLRRCLRIWPLYFLILAITAGLLAFNLDGHNLSVFKRNIWYYVFFIPNLAFVIDAIIPFASILWSVGSEEQFYLFWPFVVKYLRNYFLMALAVIIFLFTLTPEVLDYVNFHYMGGKNETVKIISLFLLRMSFNCMATGALFGYMYKRKAEYFKFIFSPIVQVIVIILTIVLWVKNVHFKFNDELYAILFAIIISNLALNTKSVLNLENSVLNYLGKISYGLYVYHIIVCSLVNAAIMLIFGHELNKVVFFFLCVISTIALASFSYEFFEKRFLKIKDKRFAIVKTGQAS